MILDNVEFKEDFDQTVTPDARVSCNQIKTKMTTFQAICSRWRNFRLSRLNQKLNNMKENLVTASFGAGSQGLTTLAEKSLDRKTNAIARLEEKIMILSKEDVPALYVKHRAIKLKEKMMSNLVFNSSFGYSVGRENYDKIFAPELSSSVNNVPQAVGSLASADGAIDVETISTKNEQNIASEVNKAMSAGAPLNRDAIQETVDNSFANINIPEVKANEETPTRVSPESESPIDRDTIKNVVDDSFGNLDMPEISAQKVTQPDSVTIESPIDRDTIDNVVHQSLDEISTPQINRTTVQPTAVEPVAPAIEPPVQSAAVEPVAPAIEPSVQPAVVEPAAPVIEPPVQPTVVEPAAPVIEPSVQPTVVEPAAPAIEPSVQPAAVEPAAPVIEPPVQSAVTEHVESLAIDKNDDSILEISPEEVQKTVESSVNGIEDKSVDEPVSDFAEEMRRRKALYNYVPMTDEEIEQARKKIGLDKNDNEMVNKNELIGEPIEKSVVEQDPVREPIVVVPDRVERPVKERISEDASQQVIRDNSYVPKVEKDNDLHFDYSEATKKDVVHASSYENSRTGLEALKARALKLQQELKQSEVDLIAARDEQTDEARKAMEVREATRAKKQKYDETLGRLQDYCNELEEQTKVNRSSAAISRNDTECNRRFIESQTAEMHAYEDKIEEICNILSTETEQQKRR